MKSLHLRGTVVSALLILIVAVSAAAVLSDLSLLHYLHFLQAGAAADDAEGATIDQRQLVIGLIQSGLFLVCGIAFLMWFHRAHKNLAEGGLIGLKYSPGWAVGGFFVPILNLVRPFQVMKEVASGSAYLAGDVEEGSWQTVSPSPLVGWWWGMLLFQSTLSRISGRLMMKADELGELVAAGWATLAADLLDVPSALLALLLVRHLTKLQEQALLARSHNQTFGADSADAARPSTFE